MLKTLLFSTSFLFLCSCVTTHPGFKAKSSVQDDSLVVSTDINDSLSDKYYMFLEYTFENKSGEWKEVRVSRIGFEGEEATELLVNERLSAWIEGAELKLKKSNYNTGVILGSIAAVGGTVGALSNNGNLQVAGLGAVAGAAGYATYQDIKNTRQAVGSGQKGLNQTVNVPKNHILVPFKVAPESYVKKWVVVKRPKDIENQSRPKEGFSARRSKDIWDDEPAEDEYGTPDLISEIMQNKKTAVYKTDFY